jgi:hypothetical protein
MARRVVGMFGSLKFGMENGGVSILVQDEFRCR